MLSNKELPLLGATLAVAVVAIALNLWPTQLAPTGALSLDTLFPCWTEIRSDGSYKQVCSFLNVNPVPTDDATIEPVEVPCVGQNCDSTESHEDTHNVSIGYPIPVPVPTPTPVPTPAPIPGPVPIPVPSPGSNASIPIIVPQPIPVPVSNPGTPIIIAPSGGQPSSTTPTIPENTTPDMHEEPSAAAPPAPSCSVCGECGANATFDLCYESACNASACTFVPGTSTFFRLIGAGWCRPNPQLCEEEPEPIPTPISTTSTHSTDSPQDSQGVIPPTGVNGAESETSEDSEENATLYWCCSNEEWSRSTSRECADKRGVIAFASDAPQSFICGETLNAPSCQQCDSCGAGLLTLCTRERCERSIGGNTYCRFDPGFLGIGGDCNPNPALCSNG